MKKILVLVVLLGLGSLVSAQGLSFGIKGGLNLSSVNGDWAQGAESRSGLAAGGYLTLSLLPSFAIQPEVLYSQKGCKLSGDNAGVPWVGEYRINYAELPVMVKYSFGILIKPYILAGPYYAVKVGSSYELAEGDSTWTGSMDNVKDSDLGFVVGAGVSTPIKLSFEARYSNSFSTIIKDDADGTSYDWKNSNISVMVGYAIF
ncbi:MAG: porin family protein [bacterium]|nr:porin family protein [bacterium]